VSSNPVRRTIFLVWILAITGQTKPMAEMFGYATDIASFDK